MPGFRRGVALFLAIALIPIFLLLLYTLVGMASASGRAARNELTRDRLFYLAEAGLQSALLGFQDSGCRAATHGGSELLSVPGLTRAADGWLEWRWRPGDPPDQSMTRSGQVELYRVRVEIPAPDRWLITCESRLGAQRAHYELGGRLAPLGAFSHYADGDVAVGNYQRVSGPVHSNRDLYLVSMFPGGTGMFRNWSSPSITALGKIKVLHDNLLMATDLVDPSDILIKRLARRFGSIYDSDAADWDLTPTAGIMRDGKLGAARLRGPSERWWGPSSPVASQAVLRITPFTSAPYLADRAFFHQGRQREVRVKELDVAALGPAFPVNGLIYSDTSLRIVNAERLPAALTVLVEGEIYVQSDFNMRYPTAADRASATSRKVPASLQAREGVYYLSDGWDDGLSYTTLAPPGNDPSRYAGDPAGEIEVNALILNALHPLGGPRRDSVYQLNGVLNPYYVNPPRILPPPAFLEDLTLLTFLQTGSNAQLQGRTMAAFDNSGSGSLWNVRDDFYRMPRMVVDLDPALAQNPPPMGPNVCYPGVLR